MRRLYAAFAGAACAALLAASAAAHAGNEGEVFQPRAEAREPRAGNEGEVIQYRTKAGGPPVLAQVLARGNAQRMQGQSLPKADDAPQAARPSYVPGTRFIPVEGDPCGTSGRCRASNASRTRHGDGAGSAPRELISTAINTGDCCCGVYDATSSPCGYTIPQNWVYDLPVDSMWYNVDGFFTSSDKSVFHPPNVPYAGYGPEDWYYVDVPPGVDFFVVETCGAASNLLANRFDTVLAVFNSCPRQYAGLPYTGLPAASLVASNDDAGTAYPGGCAGWLYDNGWSAATFSYQSLVRIKKPLPGRYWVMIDGVTAADYGYYTLFFTFLKVAGASPTPTATVTPAVPTPIPCCDKCMNQTVPLVGHVGSVVVDFYKKPNDLTYVVTSGGATYQYVGAEVVFVLDILAGATKLYLTTCGNSTSTDTVISVLTSCPYVASSISRDGRELAFNDDDQNCGTNMHASSLTLNDLPAGRYYILVDSYKPTTVYEPFTFSYVLTPGVPAMPITIPRARVPDCPYSLVPSASPSRTVTPTTTRTGSRTPSPGGVAPSRNATPTNSASATRSNTVTASVAAPSSSVTSSVTVSPTGSAPPSGSVTPTGTCAATSSGSPSVSGAASSSPTPSSTGAATVSGSPSASGAASSSPTPSATGSATNSASTSGSPAASGSPSVTPTASGSGSNAPSGTPTSSVSSSVVVGSRSVTPSVTASASLTPSASGSASGTAAATASPSGSASGAVTVSPTGSASGSPSITGTAAATSPSSSAASTASGMPTQSASAAASPSASAAAASASSSAAASASAAAASATASTAAASTSPAAASASVAAPSASVAAASTSPAAASASVAAPSASSAASRDVCPGVVSWPGVSEPALATRFAFFTLSWPVALRGPDDATGIAFELARSGSGRLCALRALIARFTGGADPASVLVTSISVGGSDAFATAQLKPPAPGAAFSPTAANACNCSAGVAAAANNVTLCGLAGASAGSAAGTGASAVSAALLPPASSSFTSAIANVTFAIELAAFTAAGNTTLGAGAFLACPGLKGAIGALLGNATTGGHPGIPGSLVASDPTDAAGMPLVTPTASPVTTASEAEATGSLGAAIGAVLGAVAVFALVAAAAARKRYAKKAASRKLLGGSGGSPANSSAPGEEALPEDLEIADGVLSGSGPASAFARAGSGALGKDGASSRGVITGSRSGNGSLSSDIKDVEGLTSPARRAGSFGDADSLMGGNGLRKQFPGGLTPGGASSRSASKLGDAASSNLANPEFGDGDDDSAGGAGGKVNPLGRNRNTFAPQRMTGPGSGAGGAYGAGNDADFGLGGEGGPGSPAAGASSRNLRYYNEKGLKRGGGLMSSSQRYLNQGMEDAAGRSGFAPVKRMTPAARQAMLRANATAPGASSRGLGTAAAGLTSASSALGAANPLLAAPGSPLGIRPQLSHMQSVVNFNLGGSVAAPASPGLGPASPALAGGLASPLSLPSRTTN